MISIFRPKLYILYTFRFKVSGKTIHLSIHQLYIFAPNYTPFLTKVGRHATSNPPSFASYGIPLR